MVVTLFYLMSSPPLFFLTYELKKRHKQHHCALATLPNVADEHTLLSITQIAHCSALTTREGHLFKAIDSISVLKSLVWISRSQKQRPAPWITLSKFLIAEPLWGS